MEKKEKPKLVKIERTFSPFEEEDSPLQIFETNVDGAKLTLKIRELTGGEDNKITQSAMRVRGKGRKREWDFDTGILRVERIYYSCRKPDTGLWVNGERVELTRENIPKLKQKISDWSYDKIQDVNEVTEEEEKNSER